MNTTPRLSESFESYKIDTIQRGYFDEDSASYPRQNTRVETLKAFESTSFLSLFIQIFNLCFSNLESISFIVWKFEGVQLGREKSVWFIIKKKIVTTITLFS